MDDLVRDLFPNETTNNPNPLPAFEYSEDTLIRIPGAILHLIHKQQNIELASGDLIIVRLRQNDNVVAVLARVADEIQWPLARDEAAVKLDDSHYFFTLREPPEHDDTAGANQTYNMLNYGLTIASKGQEKLLKEFDGVLEQYSAFSVKKAEGKTATTAWKVSPAEMGKGGDKEELAKGMSAAYWTTLAPNVEDYSGSVAKIIAAGSGQVIRGILWCGGVTSDRLRWGDEVLKYIFIVLILGIIYVITTCEH